MHMMRKKLNEKASVIPVRPPAPALKEIQSDISGADKDDFVFTSGSALKGDQSLETEWGELMVTDDMSGGPDLKKFAKVEENYNKILKFVKIHEKLKSGQEELEKSSEKLVSSRELVDSEKIALEEKLERQQSLFNVSFDEVSS